MKKMIAALLGILAFVAMALPHGKAQAGAQASLVPDPSNLGLTANDLVSFRLSHNAPVQTWQGMADDQNGWFITALVPQGKKLVLKAIIFGRNSGTPVLSSTGLVGITNICPPIPITNHSIYWQIDNGNMLKGTTLEAGTIISAGQQQEHWVVAWLIDA